jgi:Holliday junction resolvase RusA-like endonuclease
VIRLTIPGPPQGKGRARFGNGRAYTPAKTVAYEKQIAAAAREAMHGREPLDGPVHVVVNAFFAVPKSWSKKRRADAMQRLAWHTGKPDGDNIAKAVCDGLNGITWADDCQVAFLKVTKQYAEVARVEVMVERLF